MTDRATLLELARLDSAIGCQRIEIDHIRGELSALRVRHGEALVEIDRLARHCDLLRDRKAQR